MSEHPSLSEYLSPYPTCIYFFIYFYFCASCKYLVVDNYIDLLHNCYYSNEISTQNRTELM